MERIHAVLLVSALNEFDGRKLWKTLQNASKPQKCPNAISKPMINTTVQTISNCARKRQNYRGPKLYLYPVNGFVSVFPLSNLYLCATISAGHDELFCIASSDNKMSVEPL